ncbi:MULTISPECIES: hypothetical protein [unclassified Vibrio]|uniref:hypothetical protein n=1 Tax=unclassified Vibrio TaxID=2614977 RepID=UPI0012AA3353|nr:MULTISPECIES: hypothetical protein [unclassified Vibrio]QFT39681.1 hypothetical protein FIU99_25175 [Vibrio sp. THAF64]QGM37812.1 hypothetical protein GGC04_26305 [Vibrio sp. THAF191d]QGN73155.1 hypothetical protein GGC03_25530 [Vibrio sp. THAF191c]
MISFEFYDVLLLFMLMASCGFVYVDHIEGSVVRALFNIGIAAFCAFGLFVRLGV